MPIAVPATIATPKFFTGKSSVPLTHDIVCWHTMVGTLAGSWQYANGSGNPYWHFGINGDGDCWYCHDLAFRSAANLNGNWHVIPIETSDVNEGVFPVPWANPLWTPKQEDKIVVLTAWLCKRFNIPPVLIPDTLPGRRGIAYHRQGIEPWLVPGGERWSNADGKICPANRVSQIGRMVARVKALVEGVEAPDMTPEQNTLLERIAASVVPFYQINDARFRVQTLIQETNADDFAAIKGLLTESRLLTIISKGVEAEIDAIATAVANKIVGMPGGPTLELTQVIAAVKQALREGTGE